jgi:chaperonin cofactor prefoldin
MSLTEADKQWIVSQLERSAERTTSRMGSFEERMNSRMDSFEERMNSRMENLEERMNSRVEHVETALLTEFHKWASPMEMRVKSHSTVLRALDLEIESISERVTKLEGK